MASFRQKIVPGNKIVEDIFLDIDPKKLQAKKIISPRRKKTPLLEINNITKKFGKGKNATIAVNDVSLVINDKENLALLGANGAGKTTLVEMICGLSKQSSGKITPYYEYKNSYQERLGIQFQDSSYPGGLKVRDIVNFVAEVYNTGTPKKEREKELEKIVNMFGLRAYWKKYARSLSGGQQQRLNILLALLNKPKIVFLDELSTGLDISVREQIKRFVKQYCEAHNINIVLVSHDIKEIETLCDRIVIMQKGIIKVDMYIDEVTKKFGNVESLLEKYI